jgi:hypothetical protein
MRMYYGLEGTVTDRTLGGGYVPNILVSATVLWRGWKVAKNDQQGTFRSIRPPAHESLYLDSGGYAFFHRHGDYPYTLDQYAALAVAYGADFVSTMDYPCEVGVKRPERLRTNVDRIRRTVENASTAMERFPKLPWVPVVQGFAPQEYEASADLIVDAGLERPVMAIGTLCARKSADEAWAIIRTVARKLPGVKLHGFGIDMRFLRDRRIRSTLWSADTSAWKFNPPSGRMFPRNDEKAATFTKYSARIDDIIKPREHSLESYNDECA